jgi:hypothetical protein
VPTARAQIESLLKARKLDVTLTSEMPAGAAAPLDAADLAATGAPAIDAARAPLGDRRRAFVRTDRSRLLCACRGR